MIVILSFDNFEMHDGLPPPKKKKKKKEVIVRFYTAFLCELSLKKLLKDFKFLNFWIMSCFLNFAFQSTCKSSFFLHVNILIYLGSFVVCRIIGLT